MLPAWRLATSSLDGKRGRTGLLAGAVALAASLITAVACGMASVSVSMEDRLDAAVGRADVTLAHVAGAAFDDGALAIVRSWDEVDVAAPHSLGPLPLRFGDHELVANGSGVEPEVENKLRRYRLADGRFVEAAGEVVIEHRVSTALGAGVGDTLEVPRFGSPMTLTVVGVLQPETLNKLARRWAYVTREQLIAHDPLATRLSRIGIDLPDSEDVDAFIARHQAELPRGLILEPTERAAAGLARNMRVMQIGLFIWTVFAFLASSFIILTGLTTSVAERQRELAIVRCIGGTRRQIAAAQLIVGGIVGAVGAVIGVPAGVALAYIATLVYEQHLPGGLVVPPAWMAMAIAGCLASGLAGAVWPAWRAARTSPLEALAVRARSGARSAVLGLAGAGLLCVSTQGLLMFFINDAQLIYWTYITVGAPLMLIGYFLLSVPVTLIAARACTPIIARILRLPPALLSGAIAHSPVRHGFAAGSLMTGLALLVGIWTSGRALMDNWIGAIEFPDAFVHSVAGLPQDAIDRLVALDAVDQTCAISMVTVKTNFLGVQALSQLSSTFIAFDPEPFFDMTKLEWIEGDEDTARERLERGGGVLIAREFAVARQIGVGDVFPFEFRGQQHEMDIVGVVAAPGLDLVGKYFDVGAQFQNQALHAVFGTRSEMNLRFGNDSVQFVQIDLNDRYTDEEAVEAIRAEFRNSIITVGSGRAIKDNIAAMGTTSMKVVSSIAIAAMLIACFGVANVVVAGIQARAYEFGVLRAVGASGGTLARLIVGETLLVALGACVVGIAMGAQASIAETVLWAGLAGIDVTLALQPDAILLGSATITLLALAAATPAALRLAKRPPRELLATRG